MAVTDVRRARRTRSLPFVLVAFALLLASCSPAAGPGQGASCTSRMLGPAEEATLADARATARVPLSLKGDPAFDAASLSRDEALWYRRLWAALENPNAATDAVWLAQSGNLYQYARPLNLHVTSLLAVFRATGDLALLDEVACLTDAMYATLRDSWLSASGPVDPADGTSGLRRWLYLRGEEDASHFGQDRREIDVVLAHGLIANVTYALEVNRDVPSPAGLSYGARADQWKAYLKDDFEVIWETRNGSDLPLWSQRVSHSYRSSMRWHYFMGRLFGDDAYLRAAEGIAAEVHANERVVPVPGGEAVVWSHQLLDPGYGLQPMVYAAYDWAIMLELALDGFAPFRDPAYLRRHAATLRTFVIDNGSRDFSFDVGGMTERAGIPARSPWDASSLRAEREGAARFASRSFAHLAAFDPTGNVRRVAEEVYFRLESNPQRPRRAFLPAGVFFAIATSR